MRRISNTDFGVPSIKDALQGKFKEDNLSAKEQHQIYNQTDEMESFSADDLKLKWKEFVKRLDDKPNLKSTLTDIPELTNNFKLILKIENSVQEDAVNSIKPELISWLRKELRNSKIQLITKITKKIKGRIIYSDNEKFEEMVKKNPDLALLKRKFNLDFGQ